MLQVRDESEQTFIVEVFSGCVRYNNILDVVLNGFYAKDGKNILKSEQNLYAGKEIHTSGFIPSSPVIET